MLVVLELLDQPLDFVLACCILLLDCRKRYSRYSVVHGVVTSFTVTFRIAWWFQTWSCVLALWILLTALRSQANLLVELLLCFHTYRCLNANRKQCVVENDRVWLCLVKLQAFLLSELQFAPKYSILESGSKYSCMGRSLVSSCRVESLPCHFHPPSDSL